MAKKTQNAVFLVAADGLITVKNFEPRTFGDALGGNLKKGWKKDAAKLAAAVEETPDLLTAAVGLMGAAQDILAGELDKLSDQINSIYETAINDSDRDFTKEEIKLLDKLEPNVDQLSEDLEDMATMAPSAWLLLSSKKSYKVITKVFGEFFKLPVVDGWECFSPSLDTPAGRAAHNLRCMGLGAADAFELEFGYESEIAPEFVKTKMKIDALNEAAKQAGFAVSFVEDIIPQRAAEKKAPAKKTEAKKPQVKAVAKPTAKKAPVKVATKPAAKKPSIAKKTDAGINKFVAKKTPVKTQTKAVAKTPVAKPATKPAIKTPATKTTALTEKVAAPTAKPEVAEVKPVTPAAKA